MNLTKKHSVVFYISLFLIITFTTLITISFNSTYLITLPIRVILIILVVLLLAYIIFYIKINKKIKKVAFILFTIYFLGCSGFLFLLYGSNETFRTWLITTAMKTKTHQYYCMWFYSDETIEKVLSENFLVEPEGNTDPNLINGQVTYANEYEKQILDRDSDALYKIIRFKVNDQDAYLAAIYDPADVHVAVTKDLNVSGQFVTEMAEDHKAPLAINGGNFIDPNYSSTGGTPKGITFSMGQMYTGTGQISNIVGFNEDNVLMLMRNTSSTEVENNNIRDCVYGYPFLIVNGEPAFARGNGGWGYAARTAIGQRSDGIVLMLVVDSNEFRTNGASMIDMTEIMQRYGAVNASALDGGTSSVMVENYELISDPIDGGLRHQTRPVATSFIVKDLDK